METQKAKYHVLNDKQKLKAMMIMTQEKERYNTLTRPQILEDLQGKLDFVIKQSNVDHLCDVVGVTPARMRPVYPAVDDRKDVLIDIVELLEDIVFSVSRADIFTGNIHFAPAVSKLEQIKKALA